MLNDCVEKLCEAATLRIQFAALPLGNKKEYHSVLTHAFGGNITDEEYSRMVQIYRKLIWQPLHYEFPGEASNVVFGGSRRTRRSQKAPPKRVLRGAPKAVQKAPPKAPLRHNDLDPNFEDGEHFWV